MLSRDTVLAARQGFRLGPFQLPLCLMEGELTPPENRGAYLRIQRYFHYGSMGISAEQNTTELSGTPFLYVRLYLPP